MWLLMRKLRIALNNNLKEVTMKVSTINKLLQTTILSAAFVLPMSVNAASDQAQVESSDSCPAYLNQTMRLLHSSEEVNLCQLTKDKTVVFVNTASNCGFTPQFKGLEALYKENKDKGLVVVGFPSDDFFQEEDDEKDTAKVCFVNYGVTFPMMETTSVRGDDANPVFAHLGEKTTSPKWNFYKYLVTNNGANVQHFNSRVSPDDEEFVQALNSALAQ